MQWVGTNVTGQFNDLVRLLVNKRLKRNLGTKHTEDNHKEEDKLTMSKPSICEVDPSARVTRERRLDVETSERTEVVPAM